MTYEDKLKRYAEIKKVAKKLKKEREAEFTEKRRKAEDERYRKDALESVYLQ